MDLVADNTIETNFKKMDIEPELQVSILAGLVQTSGWSCYLTDEKKNSSSVSMSMIYRKKTVSEEVFLRHLRNKIDIDVFKPKNGVPLDATHVVIGIKRGMTQTFTCEHQYADSDDLNKVKEKITGKDEKRKRQL